MLRAPQFYPDPSTVSYEDVREGNDPYRALGHGTHSFSTGT